MKCSFIITLIDRYEDLWNCIASIEKAYEFAKDIEVEILVIFKGDDDKRAFIRAKYPQFVITDTVKDIGLSSGRNIGIRKSTGEYLIFVDDDGGIREDFLAVLSENIAAKKADAFCGRLRDPVSNAIFEERHSGSRIKRLGWFDFHYFKGSSIVLKRDILEKVGFFDEEFGSGAVYYAAEDSDIFFRLKRMGIKILYIPDLTFFHPISNLTDPRKAFNYSYAIGAMLAKQVFVEKKHSFVYLSIISETILKNFLRTLQCILFPERTRLKDMRFRYRHVLLGMVNGVFDYTKRRVGYILSQKGMTDCL